MLTKNSDVLVFGNFANMLSMGDDSQAHAEFLKLSFFNQMKIIQISCSEQVAFFLSQDGMLYVWGRDSH